ncbi:MAG: hypothetical protein AAGD25_17880 [Cyanobacteria bacterium P01_F01_bin.150]
MDYLAIAQTILKSLPLSQEFYEDGPEPIRRKPQSDDERIAEIAWARMRLMQQERSSSGPTMLFL